jgi:GNAT superfamily N-acetyltransferase
MPGRRAARGIRTLGEQVSRVVDAHRATGWFAQAAQSVLHATDEAPLVRVRAPLLRTQYDAPAQPIDRSQDQVALLHLLSEPGSLGAGRVVGTEIVVGRRLTRVGNIDVTRTETYVTPEGVRQSDARYILRARSDGRILAAAKIAIASGLRGKSEVTLLGLIVAPALRRRGLATKLLDELAADHPQIRARSRMTRSGAAFLRYAPWPKEEQHESAQAAEAEALMNLAQDLVEQAENATAEAVETIVAESAQTPAETDEAQAAVSAERGG